MTAIIAANNAIQSASNTLQTSNGESSLMGLFFVLGIVVAVSIVGFVAMKDF